MASGDAFNRLVGKWIEDCRKCGISPHAIDRARSFIDGEAYTPADKKPEPLAALLSWYMDADTMENELPPDELMSSSLWRLMSLCEKAYYMGRDDATSDSSTSTR